MDNTGIIAARIKFIISSIFFVGGASHKNGLVTPAVIKEDDVCSKRRLEYQYRYAFLFSITHKEVPLEM